MATTLRRNPIRNRSAPKRFEDEKFVSGAIDRYQHCYDANRPKNTMILTAMKIIILLEMVANSQHLLGTLIILCIDTHYVTLQKVYWNLLVYGVIWVWCCLLGSI